ncbi:chorismate dehydratase [Planctomycetales bacterium]|nr:chorismate dehydratase [Planctomycetales bacterium]
MLRIGTVPYCNAFPLIHFLQEELPGTVLSEWIPSDMRLRLMAHHLDLVLMPVAELMSLPHGKIVSNCAIACNGAVRSVRLISRRPIEKIKTLSLDTASRSSITICELILRHFYGLNPVKYKLSADQPLNDCKTDAFVVIGDRALAHQPSDQWEYRYDLGELWKLKTGLPLVFAAWIGNSESAWNVSTIQSLQSSRDRGLANLETVIDAKAGTGVSLPVPKNEVLDYYRHAVVYTLGQQERISLQTFFDLALLYGLTKHRTVLEVVDC